MIQNDPARLEELALERAAWLRKIRARLQEGSATTNALAALCGVKGRRVYHRFRALLCWENGIVRTGMDVGPTGHQNVVWALTTKKPPGD